MKKIFIYQMIMSFILVFHNQAMDETKPTQEKTQDISSSIDSKKLSVSVYIPQIPKGWNYTFGHSISQRTFGEMKFVAVNGDHQEQTSDIGKVKPIESFTKGEETDRFGGKQGTPNWDVPNWEKISFQIEYVLESTYGDVPIKKIVTCTNPELLEKKFFTKDNIKNLQAVKSILKLTTAKDSKGRIDPKGEGEITCSIDYR
jgi:hypothetical protein